MGKGGRCGRYWTQEKLFYWELNCVSPQGMSKPVPQEPMNATLFGNRVSVDVTK